MSNHTSNHQQVDADDYDEETQGCEQPMFLGVDCGAPVVDDTGFCAQHQDGEDPDLGRDLRTGR